MRAAALFASIVALSACGVETPPAPPETPEPPAETQKADGCMSDAEGQTACLLEAFALDECDGLKIQGSMFKDDAGGASYEYYSAFIASTDCVEALKSAADERGFSDQSIRIFTSDDREGYSEELYFSATTDGLVGGIEWERTQQ
ncbi:MAG: hypothetical protein SXU28_13955 [Pseudomonadota bacterium]|nr:hypothetical protein [Pseudomonadota bacterium]